MSAGVYIGHRNSLDEWEWVDREGLVKILLLDVLFNIFVADGLTIDVGGAEVHSGGVVVLIINDVHGVESDVFFSLFFLLLVLRAVQDDDVITIFSCDILLFSCLYDRDPLLTESFLMDEILLLLVEINTSRVGF